jgi:RHS repeat-associated protein
MRQYSPQAALLAIDMAQSVLRRGQALRVYAPFGHMPGQRGETAFTGQLSESSLYVSGNGYRAYLPTLGRFVSPDAVSPFGQGGRNAYAYCDGDPVNRRDNEGDSWRSLLGKFVSKSKSVKPVYSALELRYAGVGQGKVLRFATSEVTDPTLMYKALGTHLAGSQGGFGVMTRNAERVKASAKGFEAIPGYAPLRDPSLFEQAIERQHASVWGKEAIKPIGPGDWPGLRQGSLDLDDGDARRVVLSYLYYQELANPQIVQIRGRVDPWSSGRA